MTDQERDDWGDDGGLRPQLDAYADARLRADPEARARSRARVMAEARAAAPERRLAAAGGRRAVASSQPGLRLVLGRFGMPAAVAATLLLVGALTIGTALAGSGPGGPFYAARLWVEELALPTEAAARAEAQLARLEARLVEAAAAAEAGNGAAVTAVLEAYRAGADEALSDAGIDPARREHLATELGRHVAVLDALVPLVPDRASEAIRDAVDRTETRIEEILATPPGVAPGQPGKPEVAPKPTPPGKPEATPNLPATPKPTPPGKPETPPGKPEATPAP
jgi:hypothetical protein